MNKKGMIKELTSKKTKRQYVRFIFAGSITLLLNLLLLYIFTDIFQIYYIASSIFAAIISSTLNFMIIRSWTFGEKNETRFWKQYFNFYIIRLFSAIVVLIALFVLTEFFGVYYIISQAVGLLLGGIINFLGNKFYNFKK